MIDRNRDLWLIRVPESVIRNQPLFHATQDRERAEALSKEEGMPAIRIPLDEAVSFDTWSHVTRWECTG